MGSGKHPLEFRRFHTLLQKIVHLRNFGQGGHVSGFFTQFDHNPHILKLAIERIPQLHDFFQGGPFLQDSLGVFTGIPKTGSSDFRFDLLD